jgi:thiol-disulfide isomerase/thioredoxin/Tfp pilus assembly protein PilF
MRRTRSLAFLAAFVLLIPALLDNATSMATATRPAARSDQAAGAVRFGRVTTASEVQAWGNYVVKSEFLPGDRVFLYAETLDTVRAGRVDMTFHFQASASDGKSVYDATAEFNEAAKTANWCAWRYFALPPRALPGTYTLRVDVLNRLTGERGEKIVGFAVVSAARTLPAAAPAAAGGEADADTPSTEPLSPEMEEAFALLRLRQYEEAVRMFRKALGQDKTSARGYFGLAQAYDGLSAYKNVLESCDRAIEFAQTPRMKAAVHNLKGVSLFARASQKQPPNNDDLLAAEKEFRAVLGIDPAFHMVRYNLGVVMLKAGNDAAGIDWLIGYLEVAPDGAAAKDAVRMIANPRRARENFAPDFSIVTLDGEHVDLESLRGQVVVLDFWASWCAPCREAVPYLRGIQKKFTGRPVTLISISVDQDAAAWKRAIASGKMGWRHYLDTSGHVAKLFGVRPIPTTVVIDGEGIIRDTITGFTPSFGVTLEDDILKALKALATW